MAFVSLLLPSSLPKKRAPKPNTSETPMAPRPCSEKQRKKKRAAEAALRHEVGLLLDATADTDRERERESAYRAGFATRFVPRSSFPQLVWFGGLDSPFGFNK